MSLNQWQVAAIRKIQKTFMEKYMDFCPTWLEFLLWLKVQVQFVRKRNTDRYSDEVNHIHIVPHDRGTCCRAINAKH